MSVNSIHIRLARLEGPSGAGQIPVWCDEPEDVPSAIDAMVASGEIAERDRSRCVYWVRITSLAAGYPSHDTCVAMLAAEDADLNATIVEQLPRGAA